MREKTNPPSVSRQKWQQRKSDGTYRTVKRWRLRWPIGPRCSGRRTQRQVGGFSTREEALNYYRTQVVPALDAGFDHPNDYLTALEQEKKTKFLTVREWFDEYVSIYSGHMKTSTRKNLCSVLDRAAEEFGEEILLSSVTTKQVSNFVEKILRNGSNAENGKTLSPDTKRSRLLIVRRAFEIAVKGGFLGSNPCEPLKLPKAIGKRIRYFDLSEFHCLVKKLGEYKPRDVYDSTPETLQAMVVLAFYSGLRRSEIFHLEWNDFQIDLKNEDYRVQVNSKSKFGWTPKNNIGRIIGFNPIVWEYLKLMKESRERTLTMYRERLTELSEWKRDRDNGNVPKNIPKVFSNYKCRPGVQRLINNTRSVIAILEQQVASTLVFPATTGERLKEIPRAYGSALTDLGLKSQPDTSFHTLRHSFASHLVMAGVDLPTVKDLMGHADIKTTMRYTHLAPSHRSTAGSKMPSFNPESGRAKEGRNNRADIVDIA